MENTLTLKTVAEKLGISVAWLRRMCQQGKCPIPYTRLSARKTLFKESDVQKYIEEHTYAGK